MDRGGRRLYIADAMDEELFQRMQEAAGRFRSGESDYEEIPTPNGLAVLVRDANDPRGFRIDFVGEGAKHSVPIQEYPASASRPPGYPAPLPFLPGCAATINTLDQSVTWKKVLDPEEALDRLSRETAEDGWVEVEAADSSRGGVGARRVFEKDGAERALSVESPWGPPQVVLRERLRHVT